MSDFWGWVRRLFGRPTPTTQDEPLPRANPDDALDKLARLPLSQRQSPANLLKKAELLLQKGDPNAALLLLGPLLEADQGLLLSTEERRARGLLAEAYYQGGNDPLAREQVAALLFADVDDPTALRLHPLLAPAKSIDASYAQGTGTGTAEAPFAFSTLLSVEGVGHDRYRLLKELGRGGSGAVYLAWDLELDRHLALKIFHRKNRQGQRRSLAHLWNEARVLAGLRHRGVVALYDLDEEHDRVVMEYCAGGSLQARLAKGPLLLPVALERAIEVLTTLSVLQDMGLVHGDLKPGNLLFRGGRRDGTDRDLWGDLVIADFGLARLQNQTPEDLDLRRTAGTLGYLAPEGGPPSLAGDRYALGVLLGQLFGDPLPSQLAPLGPILRALVGADPLGRPTCAEVLSALRRLT